MLYKPIELGIDYPARTARVEGTGRNRGQGRVHPQSGDRAVHQVRVNLPTGFEFTDSEVVSGKSRATGPIELDLDGRTPLARIHWSTHGVVR